DLFGKADEAEAAQPMVRRPGRNRIGVTTLPAHILERILPAPLELDTETLLHQLDLGAHEPAQQDVADTVVDGIGIVDPILLNETAFEPELGGDGRHLARVVGLDTADRDQRVAVLLQRLRDQVFELSDLVAAERQSAVAILAFCIDLNLPAKMPR